MQTHHPGDVLAGRYVTDALLSEVDDARFWFAYDNVLARNVALHVISRDDPRSERLLHAAALAATISDSRMLKILDAEADDHLVFVVNEWGHGTSLNNLVAGSGPLTPRQASWVVAEVAESIDAAHRGGVPHRRLNPENVMIDPLGSVRVIGFAVDAVLHEKVLPDGSIDGADTDPAASQAGDVTDLAGLLHFGLTGRWAGQSFSTVPAVPVHHGKVLRPRQVRAGVPRALDDLVDGVLNSENHQWSAAAIAAVLSDFVGDPAGIGAQIIATAGAPTVVPQVELSPFPERLLTEYDDHTEHDDHTGYDDQTGTSGSAEQQPALAEASRPTLTAEAVSPASTTGAAGHSVTAAATEPSPMAGIDVPTELGMPVFDDDSDDVAWFSPRSTPPPPPPPLPEPPPKPLFAPGPAAVVLPTEPRLAPPPVSDSGYWPWTATGSFSMDPNQRPADTGRNRFWIILAIALVLAIAASAYALVNLRHTDSRAGTGEPSPEPSSSTPLPQPIRQLVATDLDPEDASGHESPELLRFAVDGDPRTSWDTENYHAQFGTATSLKSGLGLVIDLGGEYDVSEVRVDLGGGPATIKVFVSASAPTGAPTGAPVRTISAGDDGGKATFASVPGAFVTLWITKLPPVPGGYQARVAGVSVFGVPAR